MRQRLSRRGGLQSGGPYDVSAVETNSVASFAGRLHVNTVRGADERCSRCGPWRIERHTARNDRTATQLRFGGEFASNHRTAMFH